jgi:hypothetical protein
VTRAWKQTWFETGIRARSAGLWRGVEAQHIVSTMRLAEDAGQRVLVQEAEGQH